MIEQQSGEQVTGAVVAPDATIGAHAPVVTDLARVRSKPRLRPYERSWLWISRAIILAFIVLMFYPIFAIIATSFSVGSNFAGSSLIPSQLTLDHYRHMLTPSYVDFLVWVRNSAIVCIGTGVLSVLLVATTGYAFSRFHFIGRKYGLMALLLIQMFPSQMSFIAFYFLLLKLHILNTMIGLIFVYLGGGIPFNAWLFKGYIDGLPRDLEESAYVDGATRWQAFYRIILPLTRPMMAVIFIFTITGVYNDYILANFLTSDSQHHTVAVGLQTFIANAFNQNWADFSAAAVLACLPIMIAFLIAQKWLVSGLAAGAVKG